MQSFFVFFSVQITKSGISYRVYPGEFGKWAWKHEYSQTNPWERGPGGYPQEN